MFAKQKGQFEELRRLRVSRFSMVVLAAMLGSSCGHGGATVPQAPALPDVPPLILDAIHATCPQADGNPTVILRVVRQCEKYVNKSDLAKSDFLGLGACVWGVCHSDPTPEPSTAPPAPSATTAPPIATPSPTSAPTPAPRPTKYYVPAVDTKCLSADPAPDNPKPATSQYFKDVRAAIELYRNSNPTRFDGRRLISPAFWNDYYFGVVANLKTFGYEAVVDDCGHQGICGEIAVAAGGTAQGDGSDEQFNILTSSGELRDPIIGGGFRSTCTPKWF